MTYCEQKTNGGRIGALALIARRYVLESQRMRTACLFTDHLAFAEEYKSGLVRVLYEQHALGIYAFCLANGDDLRLVVGAEVVDAQGVAR